MLRLPMMDFTTIDREIAMHSGLLPLSLASLSLGLGLVTAAPASWAADNFSAVTPNVTPTITSADKPAKAKKPKQARAPKPPAPPGTGENKAERDKRLLRECRGKTNAGACEGYAS
jgi:hypothetical protein